MIAIVAMVSCKKVYNATSPMPAPDPVKKPLLKEINIPNLPSPYYHFDYRADSTVRNVSFASGFTMYDVIYAENRIAEMRNNIIVNHDTLRYVYDNSGKVTLINFINDQGDIYRHAVFTYDGQQVKEIDWGLGNGNTGFITDRTLSFVYFPDGNVKEIREDRPAMNGQPENTFITHYDQYDNKTNVDDFMLFEDGYHDHLFLLPGLTIQKNNPRSEIRTGDGVNYSVNYTYNYNNDGSPLIKSGDVLFTTGQQAGQRFQTTVNYSYY